jgi:hypothetical protein
MSVTSPKASFWEVRIGEALSGGEGALAGGEVPSVVMVPWPVVRVPWPRQHNLLPTGQGAWEAGQCPGTLASTRQGTRQHQHQTRDTAGPGTQPRATTGFGIQPRNTAGLGTPLGPPQG